MYVKIVIALIVLCCVVSMTQSEKSYERPSYGYKKKVKYGPPKYYGRPNRGYYYNPPDDYSARKPKVSKRPTNYGAGDINNIFKQLSKEDLDKIIEFAGEQDEKHTHNTFEYTPPRDDFKIQINDFEDYSSHVNEDENKIFKDFVQQFDARNNYNTVYEEPKPFSMDSYKKNEHKTDSDEYVELSPPPKEDFKITFSGFEDTNPNEYSTTKNEEPVFNEFVENNSKEYETVYDIEEPKTLESSHNPSQRNFNYNQPINSPNIFDTSIVALKNEESMLQSQIAYLQSQIKDGVVYTDSNMMQEEILPKPMNLRDEQETSFTNNVPTYARADSSSYKLENFGSLPLMDYNSKRDSLSSYHVPHYTVTSLPKEPSTYSVPSSSYSAPSTSYGTKIKIPVEAAPPASEAKYQSDAHLKAIKIWSHKSKGTAYTLHHDGSLSLEKPSYGVYGH